MDVPAKLIVGDRARVLIGRHWLPCEVVAVGRWSHSSGNTYPVYTVRLDGGGELNCGNNSVERRPR